jgi:hypothetical protein
MAGVKWAEFDFLPFDRMEVNMMMIRGRRG